MEGTRKARPAEPRVEFLPTTRNSTGAPPTGRGFTRPELAVLLAYAKNALYADLLDSKAPDDPYLGHELFRYFPRRSPTNTPTHSGHRLRREVIATVLANAMINRGGPAFVDHTGLGDQRRTPPKSPPPSRWRATPTASSASMPRSTRSTDTITGVTQLALYAEIEALLKRETLWFLRNADFTRAFSAIWCCATPRASPMLQGVLASLLATRRRTDHRCTHRKLRCWRRAQRHRPPHC